MLTQSKADTIKPNYRWRRQDAPVSTDRSSWSQRSEQRLAESCYPLLDGSTEDNCCCTPPPPCACRMTDPTMMKYRRFVIRYASLIHSTSSRRRGTKDTHLNPLGLPRRERLCAPQIDFGIILMTTLTKIVKNGKDRGERGAFF